MFVVSFVAKNSFHGLNVQMLNLKYMCMFSNVLMCSVHRHALGRGKNNKRVNTWEDILLMF